MSDMHKRNRGDRRETPGDPPSSERRAGQVRELQLRAERKSESHIVLHMANEFISQNSYLLDEALERLSPFGPGLRIEIEMSRVPYADSEALGRLMAWSKKTTQAGASLVLLNPTPYVASIIEVLHLDEMMPIVRRYILPQNQP